MSEHCEFGDFLNDALCDRLVCGMNNSSIRRRLLTEKYLTLGKATSIALSLDISSQENELINIKREPDAIQNILKGRRRCFRCDGEYHLANTCRYKNAICHKCKKTGHLAKVCKNTSANPLQSGKTYMVAENNPEIQVKHGGAWPTLNIRPHIMHFRRLVFSYTE